MKITAIMMITIRTKTPPATPPMIAPTLSGLGSGFSFAKTRTILNLVSYQGNLYWWSIPYVRHAQVQRGDLTLVYMGYFDYLVVGGEPLGQTLTFDFPQL